MKYLVLMLLFPILVNASPVKIAVLDSGFAWTLSNEISMCDIGHKNYTKSSFNVDEIGHGTNVSGLIHQYAQGSSYCQIIYKVFSTVKDNSVKYTIKALQSAIEQNVDIINYSGSGTGSDWAEKDLIKMALDKGIIVVVAAGNDSLKLTTENCTIFPACYDPRIIVVGNLNNRTSNFGPVVDVWEDGNNKTALGLRFSGSSQSAAIITGKLVRRVFKNATDSSFMLRMR